MKKVIVSQRVDQITDRNEVRDAVDQKLIIWLLECNLMPFPVPNVLCANQNKKKMLNSWIDTISADGVILSGGNDIGKCTERDLTESVLIDYARRENKPLLGICRGMQMIGHNAEVKIIPVKGHVRKYHNIFGEISGNVNSYHNSALEECPEEYRITAKSEDGIIEAIAHKSMNWEGWMWHPERENSFKEKDKERLRNLFNL